MRQRLAREQHGRRGRKTDASWAHCILQLRRLLTTETIAQAWHERMRLGRYVQVANMPETDSLYDTVVAWWSQIEVLIVTGATTGRVESANTGIKTIKRTGRGFRNSANYTTSILLTSAARAVA